jgi:hypothetical protein
MNIHKIVVTSLMTFLLTVLTACGNLEFEDYPDGTPEPPTAALIAPESGAMPLESQLILGTLMLEGTDLRVSAQQAAVLLPLWQEWHDLNRNAAPSPADREALLAKIQSAMTPEQLETIAAMEPTWEKFIAFWEEAESTRVAASGGTPQTQFGSGGFPGFDQTQTLSPAEIATLQSVYRWGGDSHGPEWMVLHALIDLLEQRQAG